MSALGFCSIPAARVPSMDAAPADPRPVLGVAALSPGYPCLMPGRQGQRWGPSRSRSRLKEPVPAAAWGAGLGPAPARALCPAVGCHQPSLLHERLVLGLSPGVLSAHRCSPRHRALCFVHGGKHPRKATGLVPSEPG